MQESNINPLDGYEIITFSSAPKNSGLAGSSALLVSILIAMLNISNQQILDKKLLAEKAIKIEREVLKRSGGYQDQYATVFGGFNFIEFKKDDIRNYPLRLSNELTYELHSSMLLFETPHQREIMASQIEKEKEKDIDIGGESIEHLKLIKEYAYKMKNYLIRGDIKNLGEMLHLSWLEKKCLPGVENKFIDRLYEISREKGAYGGKICGAGGGGFLFLISDLDKRKDIIVTLEKQNCKLVNFNFDFDGATTWKII
jgi:D-glycero-alpha-D-manno-heptose-7-phosphate kinase